MLAPSFSPAPAYRFADCHLCLATRRLRRDDVLIAIEPKVFQLLEVLIEHRHRLVSKRELTQRLWPDVTVSPAALTRLVKELRRAVGDDGERQHIVRTAFKHGYQFVAPLAESRRSASERGSRTGPVWMLDEESQVLKMRG